MKRFSLGILAAASLAVGASACSSSNAFEGVAITKNPSVVASCEKVADVSAKPGNFDNTDTTTQLTREVHRKGANTLLVASDDADKGTAYRCAMPSVAATSKSSSSGSR